MFPPLEPIVPSKIIIFLATLCLLFQPLELLYSSCWSHFRSGTFICLVPDTWTIAPAEVISSLGTFVSLVPATWTILIAEVISALAPLCLLFPPLEQQFLLMLKSFPLWHFRVSCSRYVNYSSCWSHFLSGTFLSLVPATWTILPAEVISSLAQLCLLFPPLEQQFLLMLK